MLQQIRTWGLQHF